MDLTFSYVISLQTQAHAGSTPAAMLQENIDILDQNIGKVMTNGKSFKINTMLAVGAAGAKSYDMADMGMTYIRGILVKATGVVNCTVDGKQVSGKSIFLDFDEPATLPLPARITPLLVELTNASSTTAVTAIVVVVGY